MSVGVVLALHQTKENSMTDSTPTAGSDDEQYDPALDKPSQAEGEDTDVAEPEPQDATDEPIGHPSQAEGEDDSSATE
jgi:hypothetical protein